MKLNQKSIEFLVGIITGDSGHSPYLSGPQLVNYFNEFGETDLYGDGFPSRHVYVREKLNSINGEVRLKSIVERAFNCVVDLDEDELRAENIALKFSKLIAYDGYKLKKDYLGGFYQGNDFHNGPICFEVVQNQVVNTAASKVLLNEASLKESISKASSRIEINDFSGAISISYTLCEEFLKQRLTEQSVDFNENEGDIKKLYRLYAKSEGLAVEKGTHEAFKPLLSALSGLVTGFYEVANKASDRHAAKFKARKHHAVLVVNLAFSFCEFILESKKFRSA